jgi:hypothetical protein
VGEVGFGAVLVGGGAEGVGKSAEGGLRGLGGVGWGSMGGCELMIIAMSVR